MGCDAAIIICSNGQSKIAVFEAKWPRLATKNYQWDYYQTSKGLSHFSDQLERQKRYNGTLAVFEMFYCEFKPNAHLIICRKKFHHVFGMMMQCRSKTTEIIQI